MNDKEEGSKKIKSREVELELSYSGNLLNHMGVSMYASIPPALAELIANSYDADAENVSVKINNKGDKSIIVRDDGNGMSLDEVQNYFLNIGMNRRDDPERIETPIKRRKVTGRKGLGKLALFGLTNEVNIITASSKTIELVNFKMDWNNITKDATKGNRKIISYVESIDKEKHYTEVILNNLRRKTPLDIRYLAERLSWLLNFLGNDFSVLLTDDDGNKQKLEPKLRYQSIEKKDIQKTWDIPGDITVDIMGVKEEVKGKIFAGVKPLPARYRGITLYSNGRMVNRASFFEKKESSHFFSYISGWLDIDFIDKSTDNLIATNRQSINWDHDYIVSIGLQQELQSFLNRISKEWSRLRKEAKDKAVIDNGIIVEKWLHEIPKEYRNPLERILVIARQSNIEQEQTKKLIKYLFENILPPYPKLKLWYELNDRIKENEDVRRNYGAGDYYNATFEAWQCFIDYIRSLAIESNNTKKMLPFEKLNNLDGADLVYHIIKFGKEYEESLIEITSKKTDYEKNIERSFVNYAEAVYYGFKNLRSHGSKDKMKKFGIGEEECLLALKTISHLYNRLDKRHKPKPNKSSK